MTPPPRPGSIGYRDLEHAPFVSYVISHIILQKQGTMSVHYCTQNEAAVNVVGLVSKECAKSVAAQVKKDSLEVCAIPSQISGKFGAIRKKTNATPHMHLLHQL